jgi:hypothetical protein
LSILGISALVLERLGANLTDVPYRCFLAILHSVIPTKHDVFIAFYALSMTTNATPNTTMEVQRLY